MAETTQSSKKIAIANRGEVAVRIHNACKALGHTTVLLHSKPDVDSIAYRLCDETYCIGEGPAPESYINIENVIKGAKASGCDALHPGFGFLSENATFADQCERQGLTFIGPSPESMRLFGDKIKAKDFCESLEVPTLKSYRGSDQSLKRLMTEAKNLSYPVLIKASAGGGGRGMRVVHKEEDFKEALDSAKAEALKAFGSDEVFLEQYLERSKHIEVQIFGDHRGEVFVLGERECSVQRRHQKIVEEALSPSLTPELRSVVYKHALKLASTADYKNAGTVEFLFSNNQFYFLEVNTRLQVEHPVTEEVFGVDLVQAQIKTAFNEDISLKASPSGHSIECRIYAEDLKGFPSVGRIGTIDLSGEGVRVEQGFESLDTISPYYDSMIAKTIYTASDRNTCIDKAIKHLKSVKLTGLMTNIPLLLQILDHKEFRAGLMDTGFFADHFSKGLEAPLNEDEVKRLISENLMSSDEEKLFDKNWRL
jgi:3-methylcrotonyl-CoA carboxylase alpha subunit